MWGVRSGRSAARLTALLLALVICVACSEASAPPDGGDPPAGDVPGLGISESSVTVAAAGDIARHPWDGVLTANLIRATRPDAVLALGDNAYEDGTSEEYAENYDPSWGRFKDITRPIPGNHEYGTEGAAGYFEYFSDQVKDNPYYAWDAGMWRMYALNCDVDCGRDSEQLAWLIKDLAKHADKPSLAYVHEPFQTCSTRHPPARRIDDIWSALDARTGQVVLSGNNHAYERFAPTDSDGQASSDGLRQFVVGTGGVALYPLVSPCENREAETDQTHGILELELSADSYSWRFLAVDDGKVLDSGTTPVALG